MKIVTAFIFTFILGTMFFGLFHMSMSMNVAGGMTDCPFMGHEEVMCPMNLADHMEAWKSAFLAVTPTITLLLAIAGTLTFVASAAPHLIRKRLLLFALNHWRQLQQKTYSYIVRPYQELFSSGLLHPKLF